MNVSDSTASDNGTLPGGDPAAVPETDALQAAPRSLDWLDTLVVLCIAVLPDVVNACSAALWGVPHEAPFAYDAVMLITRSLQVSAPVLYLIFLRGRWADCGFVRWHWVKDPGLAVAMWLVSTFLFMAGYTALAWLLWACGWDRGLQHLYYADSAGFVRPVGGEVLLLVGMSLANGFAEELVMRGYLLPQFERLFGSTLLALGATTIFFAAYHIYQGPIGVLNALVLGGIYGSVFCLTRRLWPVALAHALADVAAYYWT